MLIYEPFNQAKNVAPRTVIRGKYSLTVKKVDDQVILECLTMACSTKFEGIYEILHCVDYKNLVFMLTHRRCDAIVPMSEVLNRKKEYPLNSLVRLGENNESSLNPVAL